MILYGNGELFMSGCIETTDNKIIVHCIGLGKCDIREYCKVKEHHTWYKKKCVICGDEIITENPKKKFCSHICNLRYSKYKDKKNEK